MAFFKEVSANFVICMSVSRSGDSVVTFER